MGVGNYYHRGAKTVYISHGEIYGDEPDDMFDAAYLVDESLIPMIAEALPKSFTMLSRRERRWVDLERKVIAVSGLFQITLVDWHGYYLAVNVEPIEDQPATPLALHRLEQTAKCIFDALAVSGLELRVRSCGWTSKLYQPCQALAA